MLALSNIQSYFQDYLMYGDIDTILPEIAPDERFDAQKRLRVYFDAYRIRLLEILKLDFTKTHTLLGDDNFEDAFNQYLLKHPSTHFSVRYFGRHFSEFLATTAPFKNYPVFAEMAQFEWSVSYTLDATDAPRVTQEMLASIAPEQWPDLRFVFHPSVTSCYFRWDTPQLWQLIDSEADPRPPVQQPAAVRWLFWRKGLQSLFQSSTPAEDKMFQAVQQNLNFSDMCEELLTLLPEEEIPLTAAQTLYKWINEGMISHIN
jgi:hypothetical protein